MNNENTVVAAKNRFPFECEPFGRAFVEAGEKSINEQIAYGILEAAKYMPIVFQPNCMLPTINLFPENGATYYSAGTGIACDDNAFEKLKSLHPEHAKDLDDIYRNLKRASTGCRINSECFTKYEGNLRNAMACWGGTWIGHANPDYYSILHKGINGMRSHIEECRKLHPDKDFLYNASAIVLDAAELLAGRIRKIAEDNAEKPEEASRRQEWIKIASTFGRIPMEPAYDMYSAVQMFWFFFTFDGNDSPGRIDQCMADYFKTSPIEESTEMVTRMLEAIHNTRAWNLCISGSDKNWNDETNGLSYLILQKVTEMGYQTPNLTMRVHRNTPEKLWEMAADCIATGTGLPAIYNDEVVCPALESIGITQEDSHEYCMNGCNQIDIMGKSHMGLEDGEVSFLKVLEFTLHDGYDCLANPPDFICHRFGSAKETASFDDFLQLFYKYLDHVTDVAISLSNRAQEAYAFYEPNPLRTCTIQGCLEKGLDYKMGGPLYGHGQILAEGIADTADSLWAIKKLVFEKKQYTMRELVCALRANFEGYEKLRQDFSHCEKFGNDIPELDELCANVVDHFFRYLKTKHTYRGGVYTGGCSPFQRAANYGKAVAAMPNGKLSGTPNFADSIAATPGCDVNGPTASLKSMMHYRQMEACSGFVGQMKFTKSLFCTPEGKASFIAMAKAYFANGGQQLSINVLDRETLLAAQKEPEKYKNLIVRVGGYSEYFNNLSPELQQNVIDRTSFTI